MLFRTRLLVTFLLAVMLPMVALGLFVRKEMTDRLTAQYERRVESLVAVIEDDLAQEGEKIVNSLGVLGETVVDDNRFRRAAVDRVQDERRYLLDYAGNAMTLTGLAMLQFQDESGRIISSGHFRNEFDRLEPELPALLASTPLGVALVQARAPDRPFLALARVDSFHMGNTRFTIVAGNKVGRRFLTRLARDADLTVALVHPGGNLIPDTEISVDGEADRAIVRELEVPFIDLERQAVTVAKFRVAHRLGELRALRRSINLWILLTVAAAIIFAIILVSWFAQRISRPLTELADKTSRIDLDRLDIDFSTRRKDEIGDLSRLLSSMTGRLRASTVQVKDAERRATLGELARQVNHDIKNGLTPIRNVFRHLAQLAKSDPGQLTEVFEERHGTLDLSIDYLESLASNYAKLSPRGERRPCDVNEIVQRVVSDLRSSEQVFELHSTLCDEAIVQGDPVSLRRIVENLVDNAIDSLGTQPGSVIVSTSLESGENDLPIVQIAVTDMGEGMSEEQRTRVFEDFYTTKEDGTGLGLSIVRRLVMDLEGSVRVESERGKGSRFVVDLPAADAT
jgi:signal transduction histidine kinase